ncbi:TPA: hypothetical protein DDW69_04595 [candidate division CPR2 bacterium]|uniref:Pilus assembly protein, PilO n=1 Tax=candidate division CPR2 bacterium GW2011_GWC1_41_48 TaxID=1618344 RepID=A0A0G0Z8F4_UNCC2|nr:MAG: hypothetical protein UT47_C0002G0203 [candidate division CPR2 bacterium GW2011_GWC2_39_35]KKR29060.1 MAG: hypothetical protein UT60_C0007G0005 [candidate division CPR2 bacterium GW2011_GWD2_39_7]KKS09323.1 MAG: hypothetical protein UU65_C0002G0101 [candidate division CPR2 bacterium GW2011_GWC1_41_48]OGB70548.1 MAG: hypothetical protein A2Y26_04375 [candidate division CPR2 bacterium GWD2_39_7]HBG82079.1 hypothetical protein [candidate division CPR2 bacterium]
MELENQGRSGYSALVIVIAIIFAILVSVLGIRPLLASNAKLTKERDQKLAELKRYTQKRDILVDAAKKETELNALKIKILEALPQSSDPTAIFAQIEGISKGLNVDTRSVKQSSASKAKNASVHEIVLNVASGGTYDDLHKTLEKLETSLRIFNVKKISLSPKKGDRIDYSFNISTYYKDEVKLED